MAHENSTVTESPDESYDDFARALQRLRGESGAPSYTELADRITAYRESRGTSPAAARVARSSVYDVFRPGRKRVNLELVEDTLRALKLDEGDVALWRQRAAAATSESVKPVGNVAERPARPPHTRTDETSLITLFTAVLCVASVGLSLILNFSVTVFALPLYLDMTGTALISFALGPWAGIGVGVSTTVLGMTMDGDFSGWLFALVQVTGAVIWGTGFRRWFGRAPWRFLLLNLLVAVACTFVAVPIIVAVLGGTALLPGGVSLAEFAQALGAGPTGAVFSVNMATSILDKLISGYVALMLVGVLGRYGFPLPAPVWTHLNKLSPRRRT